MMVYRNWLVFTLCLGLAVLTALSSAELAAQSPRAEVKNGIATYQKYCMLCHGEQADGNGKAARIHAPRPSNLLFSAMTVGQQAQIIRLGGEATGRSASMPPWGDELSREQINDLLVFLQTLKVAGR